MKFSKLIPAVAFFAVLSACRVEEPTVGEIPVTMSDRDEDVLSAINSALAPVSTSFATFNALSRRVTHSVSDQVHIKVDQRADDSFALNNQLFANSPEDSLTFDPNDAQHFTYTSKNVGSLNATYNATNVAIQLEGKAISVEGRTRVSQCQLSFIRTHGGERSIFVVMTQKDATVPVAVGSSYTDWQIDFNELNRFYRDLSDEESGASTSPSTFSGTISISVGDAGFELVAEGFSIATNAIAIKFDTTSLLWERGSGAPKSIAVVGRVLKHQEEIGAFHVMRDPSTGEIQVQIDAQE